MTTLNSATPEGLPLQLHLDSCDPTRTATISSLPDEVLLEIFDFYWQSFRDQPSYEKVWNNKNGWFKLTRVCHDWRSVVLASPSRLQLRLYFTPNSPTRAVVLERFSHLPIIVDYINATWNASLPERLISALRYPDRVCRIAISTRESEFNSETRSNRISKALSRALDLPLPSLESLELHNIRNVGPILLAASFVTSIQSLRHLRLGRSTLFPILSVTTSLVELALSVDSIPCLTRGELLTNLERLPRLRNLQVITQLQVFSFEEMPLTRTILLAELTCFRLSTKYARILDWFMAGLAAPSLRELYISVPENRRSTLHIPHLSNFIRVAGMDFFAARLAISRQTLTTSLFTHPLSIDDPPSKMFRIEALNSARLDTGNGSSVPSAMLSTLEDIFLSISDPIMFDELLLIRGLLRQFLEESRNVKVLRLHQGLEPIVAGLLRQSIANSPEVDRVETTFSGSSGTLINSNKSQFTLDSLPSLEEIVVYPTDTRKFGMLISEKERAYPPGLFGPFVTARHQVGRPVKVFWDADSDRMVPRYFTTDSLN